MATSRSRSIFARFIATNTSRPKRSSKASIASSPPKIDNSPTSASPSTSSSATSSRHEELDKVSDYYTHSDGWTNRLIQGDCLLVMTSLARTRRHGRTSPMHLHRSALRHQIRLELADQTKQPHRHRRPGRLAQRRAGTDQSLSRHLGTGHPLLSQLSARSLACRPRTTPRFRLLLCPNFG